MNPIQATPITVPLEPIPDTVEVWRDCVEQAKKIEALDPEGVKVLFDAIASRQRVLQRTLLNKEPTDSGAEYAGALGHLKGLSEFEGIVQAVVERGKTAAGKLRAAQPEGDS